MTALAEPAAQVRPPEPRRSKQFIVPLIVYTIAIGLSGYIGEIGPLWGAVVGALTFALFHRIGLTRSLVDGATLLVGGSIGFSLFSLALESRDTGITGGVALQAALGIAVTGLVVGWVVLRHSPGLRPTAVLLTGAAWGGGAYVVLLTGVALGLVDKIRDGQNQELTIALFIAVAVASGLLGAAAGISLWARLPSSLAVAFSFLVSILAWNEIGFSIVNAFDPATNSQVSVISQLYYILTVMIFFASGAHQVLVAAMFQSCVAIPPFGGLDPAGGAWYLLKEFSTIFAIGVRIAAPTIVVLLLVSASMGVIVKTVPQLNVLVVGFPIKIGVGLITFGLSLVFFKTVAMGLMEGMEGQLAKVLLAMR